LDNLPTAGIAVSPNPLAYARGSVGAPNCYRAATVRKRVRFTDSPEFCGFAALWGRMASCGRVALGLPVPRRVGKLTGPRQQDAGCQGYPLGSAGCHPVGTALRATKGVENPRRPITNPITNRSPHAIRPHIRSSQHEVFDRALQSRAPLEDPSC